MRAYHLRLAEWRLEQRLTEGRFYKLLASWCTKPPEPGAMFPFLADNDPATDAEKIGNPDEFGDLSEGNFESVANYMGAS